MAYYTATGERDARMVESGGALVPNVPYAAVVSTLYIPSYQETAPSLGPSRLSRSAQPAVDVAAGQSIADRRLLRLLLDGTEKCVGRLRAAGESDQEAMERATAGHELLEYLEEIWRLRGLREREWQKLLALVQSTLFRAAFETFTAEQSACVHALVANYLINSSLTKDDLAAAIRSIRAAGLDAWSGLSDGEKPRR